MADNVPDWLFDFLGSPHGYTNNRWGNDLEPNSIFGPTQIPFWIVGDTFPQMSLEKGSSKVEVSFLVIASHLNAFIVSLLGYNFTHKEDNNIEQFEYSISVWRDAPQCYRFYPNDDYEDQWLACTSISSIEEFLPQGVYWNYVKSSENKLFKVVAVFESTIYKLFAPLDLGQDDKWQTEVKPVPGQNDLPGNPNRLLFYEGFIQKFVTRRVRPFAEFIRLPTGHHKFVESKTEIPYANTVINRSYEINYTWHSVPFIPQACFENIGTLNKYAFDPVHEEVFKRFKNFKNTTYYGFPPGTLLLNSCSIQPFVHANGQRVYDVVYNMKYMDRGDDDNPGLGHNHIIWYNKNKSRVEYRKITHNGNEDEIGNQWNNPPIAGSDGLGIYRYSDFSFLFFKYNGYWTRDLLTHTG